MSKHLSQPHAADILTDDLEGPESARHSPIRVARRSFSAWPSLAARSKSWAAELQALDAGQAPQEEELLDVGTISQMLQVSKAAARAQIIGRRCSTKIGGRLYAPGSALATIYFNAGQAAARGLARQEARASFRRCLNESRGA